MRFAVFLVVVVLLAVSVSAMQQTQQFNKIYLNPFYRVSLSAGTNVSYNVTIAPPDGISKVVNAMLSFNIQVNGQTQTLTAWVNGKSCNNPTYSIATAFSTTGQLQAYFDCVNVINRSGVYNVTLLSAVNTGAISGWIDLTYMNNPQGTADVFGTEYVQGDPGTMFLLLKDNVGIPIVNASCTVDIYYPGTTHPEWINDGVMLYKEEGLYYYDFTVPSIVGLYMVSANCRYYESNKQYYTLTDPVGPVRNITLGTFTGDTFVLNDFSDWLYTQCDSGTGGGGSKVCDNYLEWTLQNETYNSLAAVYLGESNGAPLMTMYWWNWTSSAWVALPNTLTFKATAAGGVPSGVDEYMSNVVPVVAINNVTKKVRIRSYATAGSTFKMFNNWWALKATQSTSQIQDLKGSGEIHVSGANPLESRYIDIASCEGFADGRCALFTNDDEFDLAEGELEDFVNITAYASQLNMEVRYYSPFSVDCTALYWIKMWNGTAWVDYTNYEVYSQPAYENCEIKLQFDGVAGSSYEFWFKFDNYMKWEVDWSKHISDTINETIAEQCDDRNFTYTVPITESSVMPNDSVTKFCYQAKDDQYWINSYYVDSQFVDIAGPYASYVQEMRFYRPGLQMRYDWLINTGFFKPEMETQTSLMNQIWTWVQSLFNWSQQTENTVVMKDVGG